MREVVIVSYARTAIGKFRGSLSKTRPDDYLAEVIKAVVNSANQVNPSEIDDFVLGTAFPEAEQGLNIARNVALLAGLPNTCCGQTINRYCSSGLQSIATAANAISVGQSEIALAGGVESMSMIPNGGNNLVPNPTIMQNYSETYLSMGLTAEKVAEEYHVLRKEQDEFAVLSHEKAFKAQSSGKFDHQIIPINAVRVVQKGKYKVKEIFQFEKDEGIRPGTTFEGLSKLRPVFKMGGSVTAGNSSQMSDGAAVVMLMSREKAEMLGMKPYATIKSFAVTGVRPDIMGVGPITAIPKALKLAGLNKDDIDIFELNEAFAAQSIACIKELGLDKNKINPNGGAIALGHPLGCTGTWLTMKVIEEVKEIGGRFGVVSMCIGGGMGAAGVFEIL